MISQWNELKWNDVDDHQDNKKQYQVSRHWNQVNWSSISLLIITFFVCFLYESKFPFWIKVHEFQF